MKLLIAIDEVAKTDGEAFAVLESMLAEGQSLARRERTRASHGHVPPFRRGLRVATLAVTRPAVSRHSGATQGRESSSKEEDADPDHVSAHFKDGVLDIAIERSPESKPKQIAIKS